ncbi:hypothetical protein Nepgr_033264 [Nepenthes gracilis]|uniref:WAT1-related protein n=1 Tax=Nepenthes gracilis TaxID=150966 RepID=A0AAD3TLP0_NEPGR|nr:hypothetical protein Nepgr_033264 [Nepenthes gracilis]
MNSRLEGVLPFAVMFTVECLESGLTTISKSAMSKGMNHYVFVFYSTALASLILLPSPFMSARPPLTFSVLWKFFLLSFIGITVMMNCAFTGVSYSSPTIAAAMSNIVPAFTFLLSVIFRMEKLDLRSSIGLIKILGTAVSISGALIVTLYNGPSIIALFSDEFSLLTSNGSGPSIPQSSNLFGATTDWALGGLFLAAASFSLSIWNVLQAATLKGYPSGITIVFFSCLFATIQCALVSLIAVGDTAAWELKLGIEYAAVVYSAVFGSVVFYNAETWCIGKKGPVFVSMFKPVGIAVSAFMSVIFLGDTLYLGSIIGAAIIVCGFYAVIWAQSKELRSQSEVDGEVLESSPLADSHHSPLLHHATERA